MGASSLQRGPHPPAGGRSLIGCSLARVIGRSLCSTRGHRCCILLVGMWMMLSNIRFELHWLQGARSGDETLTFGKPPPNSAAVATNSYVGNASLPGRLQRTQEGISLSRPVPLPMPTSHACDDPNIQGILHIQMTDILGGVGTALLQLVIAQLQYADLYQLKPWVHLNNSSQVIYDPIVHAHHTTTKFHARVSRNVTWTRRPYGHYRDWVPGPPIQVSQQQTMQIFGTGIWQHYFLPVSDFVPGDTSCQSKLYVTLPLYLITPGLHGYADYATRCWRYEYLPEYITKLHIPLHVWLEPQRMRAHSIMQKYIRFRPYLRNRALGHNPDCSLTVPQQSCLGLHIRHSDKAAGRRRIETSEFLEYAIAFVQSGGGHIYIATDSSQALEEIFTLWPDVVTSRIRYSSHFVRSNDTTAVFDQQLSSHHDRTNQEALVEILALSQCQFLVHGLSAVSESAIWINSKLHYGSANLEDPDRLNATAFGTMVQQAISGESISRWPRPTTVKEWWNFPESSIERATAAIPFISSQGCETYNGILHISQVRHGSGTASSFFVDVLNQLLYAERYSLIPWIHLNTALVESLIFDPNFHNTSLSTLPHLQAETRLRKGVLSEVDALHPEFSFPGKPSEVSDELQPRDRQPVYEPGIWSSYFETISDASFLEHCTNLPLVVLKTHQVESLATRTPWSVRAWRYDSVPRHLWNESTNLIEIYGSMRRRASQMVSKFYRFRPYLLNRVNEINPKRHDTICLGVHVRVGYKPGRYRKRIKADVYIPYLDAFADAGGTAIFLASDSHRAIHYIQKSIRESTWRIIRTQGRFVVRTSKDSPTHLLESHHRVNAETMVDILALSRCQLMLHTFSSVAEAATYINVELHNTSFNLEDPDRISVDEFARLTRTLVLERSKAQSSQADNSGK